MKNKKQIITEEVDQFDLYDLNGSLLHAIDYLKGFQERYEGKHLRIEGDYVVTDGVRYLTFRVYEDREETDKEFAKRIAKINKEKEQTKAQELKELERLKKKYNT
jgi:hypothetical protein